MTPLYTLKDALISKMHGECIVFCYFLKKNILTRRLGISQGYL
jgi:hypothetical protein